MERKFAEKRKNVVTVGATIKENFSSTNEDILRIKLEAQNFNGKPSQNMVEYFYEKLSRCNRAKMDDGEIIQWIVREIGNYRYRDYLGPLSNYKRPSELLPHLILASDYIKYEKEREVRKPIGNTNTKYTRTMGANDSNKSHEICFRCRVVGHTSKECTRKTTIVCFRCSKPGLKSSECHTRKFNTDDVQSSSTTQTSSTIKKDGKPQSVLRVDSVETTQNKYYKNAIVNDTCACIH